MCKGTYSFMHSSCVWEKEVSDSSEIKVKKRFSLKVSYYEIVDYKMVHNIFPTVFKIQVTCCRPFLSL